VAESLRRADLAKRSTVHVDGRELAGKRRGTEAAPMTATPANFP
jgi:hypothetical protein